VIYAQKRAPLDINGHPLEQSSFARVLGRRQLSQVLVQWEGGNTKASLSKRLAHLYLPATSKVNLSMISGHDMYPRSW
jgi:hypothetical protein